jgi:ParB-like chromosome segregation protein Spo0J
MTVHEFSLHSIEELPVISIPVDTVTTGLSPRRQGEDQNHVRALAELDTKLPPILVRRESMQVIDGAHRLKAAKLRGDQEINARIVDGDEAAAFVLAVQANIAHGLPLSLRDRKDAARQVLSLYPQWSDRKVAEAVGLAPGTVAKLRRRPTDQNTQLDNVGRDGRSRPRDSARRREAAHRLMLDEPKLPLREIANRVGISPETARTVRRQIKEQESSEPNEGSQPTSSVDKPINVISALNFLRKDPSFRSTDAGRILLQILSSHELISAGGVKVVRSVPEHCRKPLTEAARAYSSAWQELADCLELLG